MQRRALTILSALLLVACFCAPALGQVVPRDVEKKLEKLVQTMEVKAQPKPPAWYDPAEPPLFSFVLIADIHLNRRREKLLKEAIAYINESVEPAFTAVLGDNAGHSSLAAQRNLKSLLKGGLRCPWFIVRGDNWARNFAEVFGSTRYAFTCGNIRFVFTGLDRDAEGKGIGIFDKDTWAWMKKEIAPEKKKTVVLLMHENLAPPLFLHASRLERLCEKSPCVAATLTGHLHYDLEMQTGRVKHVLVPGLGPHKLHGFKVCEVYSRYIAIRSVERHGGEYKLVHKYQKVNLPHAACTPAANPIEAFTPLAPRETVFDVDVEKAKGPLMFQLMNFAQRAGMLDKFLELLGKKKPTEKKTPKADEEEF